MKYVRPSNVRGKHSSSNDFSSERTCSDSPYSATVVMLMDIILTSASSRNVQATWSDSTPSHHRTVENRFDHQDFSNHQPCLVLLLSQTRRMFKGVPSTCVESYDIHSQFPVVLRSSDFECFVDITVTRPGLSFHLDPLSSRHDRNWNSGPKS